MTYVWYKKVGEPRRHTWVRYFLLRTKKNKNNMIVITGATGSGKTWSAMAICELISKENGVPFGIDNVVFGLLPLMRLINSRKLKKGSSIIFDEPQISISAREFQSKANRIFNYLVSTFRHRNFNLFFCTPYEDLLDKSARKLFHAKLECTSINTKTQQVILRPVILSYNSHLQKFYGEFLKARYKLPGMNRYITPKIESWGVPKPSKLLIDAYEQKKREFTDKLNTTLQRDLESYEHRQTKVKKEIKLTANQQTAISLMTSLRNASKVAETMGKKTKQIYVLLRDAKEKGIGWKL